ncbi:MAG: hypothetical protein IPO25_12840 [Saprospiraceae bacterium]|nr:hypothetical protein [Saprospiraceae bacterium]
MTISESPDDLVMFFSSNIILALVAFAFQFCTINDLNNSLSPQPSRILLANCSASLSETTFSSVPMINEYRLILLVVDVMHSISVSDVYLYFNIVADELLVLFKVFELGVVIVEL